jgi:uncharacterized protein (TIGR03382 family)
VSYVDAGYTIALVVLALYSLSLLARRRRLERAAARGGDDARLGSGSATGGQDGVRAGASPASAPRR